MRRSLGLFLTLTVAFSGIFLAFVIASGNRGRSQLIWPSPGKSERPAFNGSSTPAADSAGLALEHAVPGAAFVMTRLRRGDRRSLGLLTVGGKFALIGWQVHGTTRFVALYFA